ncbi:MAG: hypothetical protein Q8P15_01760 [Nanoarchaeota archaeon]|nr:hypothetical protein [Nanoarchaeota archaeon]
MVKEFGYNKRKDELEEYIGQYVILFPQHSATFSGRLIEIRNGYAILQPHQAAEYDEEKGPIRKMINKRTKILTAAVIGIEPTTRKSLENYCKYENKIPDSRLKNKLKSSR